MSIAEKNSGGIVWPNATIAHGGPTRSEPSSHATYQSGCAGEAIVHGSYGP